MSLPVIREHTDAVIAFYTSLGLAVGDAEAPDVEPPHITLYAIPGGGTTGTLASPNDDVELVYQVTCTAKSREQAEWLEDRAMQILQGGLEVPGRRVCRVGLDMHGGVQRDDQVMPPIFYSTPRFRITTTPSGEESS